MIDCNLFVTSTVPPFIVITNYIYLRRMDIDGSNDRNLLTYYYNYGLDYDYRFVLSNEKLNLLLCFHFVEEVICFGLTLQEIELFEVSSMELEQPYWQQEGCHQSVSLIKI